MTTPGDEAADRRPGDESAAEHAGPANDPSAATDDQPAGQPDDSTPSPEDAKAQAFMREFMTSLSDESATDEPGTDESAEDAPTDADSEAFMREFVNAFAESGEEPDVGFTLLEQPPAADVAERAKQLGHQMARELAALGPQGWRRLEAVFALTTSAETAFVEYSDDDQRSVQAQPTPEILELAREHRDVSARLSDGPWWRLLMTLTSSGEIEVDYDYGDEPFPEDQLFPAEVYRADLEAYPRQTLPVWLAAYVGHGERQSRPAQLAAAQARADRAAGVRAVLSQHEFPAFPLMSARWAVIAAAFVAAGSQWGPRVLPALGWFEGAKRSGSTLYTLPGGRAVLSGGVWNAPELHATYNEGAPMPALFAGAPEWVANPVLNPRAASGLLSFCYWWEGGRWYRGESPTSDQLAEAVPGVWTADTVVDVVTGLLAEQPTDRQREAVATLVSAAEVGVVTRDTLVDVFGDDGTFDIDSALYQLTLAGVTLTLPEPMPQAEAIERVRQYILDQEMDTSGYPLEKLRADRISVGWMVFVPTEPGEISIGRAIFYIADDGVLEQSSSSVAPSVYIADFEQRFQQRQGSVNA
ncbi:hypothetical protein [Nocardia iowensis]|uniref:Uncharacterized protein n=1 Tax=Nocardia iowensis TaxID=204891 RepID=A0ABX8RS89_NOCIO|nr:hypothetical protein [Nocardia iowensis]QXN92489.1 hypothetical protein KV110_04885 [Nocardia iowensis]